MINVKKNLKRQIVPNGLKAICCFSVHNFVIHLSTQQVIQVLLETLNVKLGILE